eukprot:9286198-Pyramimonas_sp.AAC.1
MLSSLCGAIDVMQHVLRGLSGAVGVVQSRCCNRCGPVYVVRSAWCNASCAQCKFHSVQPWCAISVVES